MVWQWEFEINFLITFKSIKIIQDIWKFLDKTRIVQANTIKTFSGWN